MLIVWFMGAVLVASPMFTGSTNGAWLLGVILIGFASFRWIRKAAQND